MGSLGVLVLGFALGLRHATDADHVAAVATIVAQKKAVRAALPVGALWGLGHSLTLLAVGGTILVFDLVIPARLALAMELPVAAMLVLLGALNVRSVMTGTPARPGALRPLGVGVVHGLAGSAAVALLVLGTVRDTLAGLGYLVVFCAGTVMGMALVTVAMAVPVATSARRFERLSRGLVLATGVGSVAFGATLAYQIAVVQGLFAQCPPVESGAAQRNPTP